MLAAGGALLGAGLAALLSGSLIQFLSTDSQQIFVDLSLNWQVLGFTTALAFLTTLLFGLLPAMKATRTAPSDALKSGARGMTASREKFGLRRVLVVSQVARLAGVAGGGAAVRAQLAEFVHTRCGIPERRSADRESGFHAAEIPEAQAGVSLRRAWWRGRRRCRA